MVRIADFYHHRWCFRPPRRGWIKYFAILVGWPFQLGGVGDRGSRSALAPHLLLVAVDGGSCTSSILFLARVITMTYSCSWLLLPAKTHTHHQPLRSSLFTTACFLRFLTPVPHSVISLECFSFFFQTIYSRASAGRKTSQHSIN